MLTHVDHLVECITNIAVNPIREHDTNRAARSEIRLGKSPQGGTLRCTVLTQFCDFATASAAITSGGHIAADKKFLEPFGVRMSPPREPEGAERGGHHTTAVDIVVPLGFTISA